MDELPGDIRKHVLWMAYKGMSIDQRRAAGIMPGKLLTPQSFVDKLHSKPTLRHVNCLQIYKCALVTLYLGKERRNHSSYTIRVTEWPEKVERICLLCDNEACEEFFAW